VHWYNHQRLLSSIGYIPPAEAEAAGVTHKILVRTGKAVTEEGQALADDVQDSLLTFAKSVPALV
jgi:hypothetical protein